MSANATQRLIHDTALRLFAERGSTRISVSELAEAAGLSRGTVYSHVVSLPNLFSEIAADMAAQMNQRVVASFGDAQDPASRLALGIRWYVRQAHDDPVWGRFVTRFAFSTSAMKTLWSGAAARDVVAGVAQRRYAIPEHELQSAMAFVGASVLAAMYLVREGLSTWRDAGSQCALMVLRGLGLAPAEALRLSTADLPELVSTE